MTRKEIDYFLNKNVFIKTSSSIIHFGVLKTGEQINDFVGSALYDDKKYYLISPNDFNIVSRLFSSSIKKISLV